MFCNAQDAHRKNLRALRVSHLKYSFANVSSVRDRLKTTRPYERILLKKKRNMRVKCPHTHTYARISKQKHLAAHVHFIQKLHRTKTGYMRCRCSIEDFFCAPIQRASLILLLQMIVAKPVLSAENKIRCLHTNKEPTQS